MGWRFRGVGGEPPRHQRIERSSTVLIRHWLKPEALSLGAMFQLVRQAQRFRFVACLRSAHDVDPAMIFDLRVPRFPAHKDGCHRDLLRRLRRARHRCRCRRTDVGAHDIGIEPEKTAEPDDG